MALLGMGQSHTRHTKTNFETAIVSAIEQIDSKPAKSLSCPTPVVPKISLLTHVNPPDYTGQLRYAKKREQFLISGGQPCNKGQGARSAVASADNASDCWLLGTPSSSGSVGNYYYGVTIITVSYDNLQLPIERSAQA